METLINVYILLYIMLFTKVLPFLEYLWPVVPLIRAKNNSFSQSSL